MKIYISLFVISVSCSKKIDAYEKDCKENTMLRKNFFYHLSNLDRYYEDRLDTISLKKITSKYDSIKSFSEKMKYINVENDKYYNDLKFFEKLIGFQNSYRVTYTEKLSHIEFRKKRSIWLKWYEHNKCDNLRRQWVVSQIRTWLNGRV